MRMKRFAAVLVAAVMGVAAGACGNSDDDSGSTSGGGGDQPYIAIISKGFQHQFWQAVKKGAEQEAQKEGARITFEGPATETEVEAQINMLTSALNKNPSDKA